MSKKRLAPPPPAPAAPSLPLGLNARDRWAAVAILAATLVAYLPALHGGFVWDDDHHVTQSALRSWAGLRAIWFDLGATEQYYPLLHSAFWVEYHLWGEATVGYHLVNIALHAGNACVFALILRRLAVPGAWLAAAIFALHPVCVESVAWITEQKNTLSTWFYLCSALAYLQFDQGRRARHYALAIALFLLALLSKTFTVTLPAALLVVFWWQRGRLSWGRDLGPLLTWFVISALAGLPTSVMERNAIGGLGAEFQLSWTERFLLAGRDICFYLEKLLWPADLTFVYPRWALDPAVAWQWLPLVAVLGLLLLLWLARRRSRGPLAALLFFVGSLFPVLGFFDVFVFIYSYVTDHFQYLPSLGIIALLSAGIAQGWRRASAAQRPMVNAAVGSLLVALGTLTWRQSGTYRDHQTLLRTTLERNPDCWMAHNNLGELLSGAGQTQEALEHFQEAVRLSPGNPLFHNNLGGSLLRLGRVAEAIAEFRRSLQLWPGSAQAHFNLGLALAQTGHVPEAITQFEQVEAIDPTIARAQVALAALRAGRPIASGR